MAAFASDRRSGWVRVLVLILCALFIFATIATPPAYAVGETVALFGLAAVLSAATAALGFKLANNAEGQATLQKMVQDFAGASIAAGLVLTGSKLNGLINGMQYIKMAVHNGKTYLDERIFAWCQQWLAKSGVYDGFSVSVPEFTDKQIVDFAGYSLDQLLTFYPSVMGQAVPYATTFIIENWDLKNVDLTGRAIFIRNNGWIFVSDSVYTGTQFTVNGDSGHIRVLTPSVVGSLYYMENPFGSYYRVGKYSNHTESFYLMGQSGGYAQTNNITTLNISSNDTGLSGEDTLGKDVIDLTLDQILERLKEWAQDWFDAGADSVTNAATGAKDLPLSVVTGAATLNPDVAEDGPLVWFPAFDWPLGKLRSGETDTKTVDQGKENASAAETATTDVAENQTVIDSLVNWALNYISPDTGLFSKFPLCVPYDAYLLVTSSLGVDAVGSDSIFGASPGDLEGVVSYDTETYSDFQPIINIKHDFELDGVTYPLDLTIDLTPWQPLVTFFREGMALLLVAELIGAEFKRIRGH